MTNRCKIRRKQEECKMVILVKVTLAKAFFLLVVTSDNEIWGMTLAWNLRKKYYVTTTF